jgi:hypothetical protein
VDADDIGIAEATVKVHRSHLMRKMKARSIPALSRMADKLELVPRGAATLLIRTISFIFVSRNSSVCAERDDGISRPRLGDPLSNHPSLPKGECAQPYLSVAESMPGRKSDNG